MKFPSFKNVWQSAEDTFRRFPLIISAGILGSGLSSFYSELEWSVKQEVTWIVPLLMTLSLSISLLLALQFFAESRQWPKKKQWNLQGLGILILAGYHFSIGWPIQGEDVLRFCLSMGCTHLLVSLSVLGDPTISTNGFWQFNRALFQRILLSLLYSGTLFLGLVLAIVLTDKLFSLHIKGDIYAHLWFAIAGVFNTWFFLAGVPKDFFQLEASQEYPKGLKLFSQYVLIPLVSLYIIILMVYTLKILVRWELPQGWVSYMVLAASLFGILSLLLVHPFSRLREHDWIKTYSQWYYIALLPLVVLMAIGIGRRVSDYSLTQNRYIVIVLTGWLLGMALYYSFSRLKNIKVIPLSLCVVIVFSTWGPWSAAPIAEYFQSQRFEKLITKHGLLTEGKLDDRPKSIAFESEKQLSSIVEYLGKNHGYDGIKKWFGDKASELELQNKKGPYHDIQQILKMMGLSYIPRYQQTQENRSLSFYTKSGPYLIRGYDILLDTNHYYHENRKGPPLETRTSLGRVWTIFGPEGHFTVKHENSPVLSFELIPLVKKLQAANAGPHNTNPEMMMIEGENTHLKAKAYLSQLNATINDQEIKVNSFSVALLIKVK